MNGGPTPGYLLLTLALFIVASLMALVVQRLTRHRFGEQEAALLAFSSGTGNTGYFGLPIALILLPPKVSLSTSSVCWGLISTNLP